jgi:long-chain acyl-CoA synthetase
MAGDSIDFAALRQSTLPGLLLERARTRPHRVAFHAKELGIYRETTWQQFADRVGAVALGLAAEFRGARGETVAIIGNPCPEWTITDLATQSLGAITYGAYPTSSPSEVRYLLQHGGAVLVVVEDQEHLDMELVADLADSVVVLDFGQRIAEGAPSAVLSDPRVAVAYLGRALTQEKGSPS